MVGFVLGAGIVSFFYEKFLMQHTRNELEVLIKKHNELKQASSVEHKPEPVKKDNREALGIKFSIITFTIFFNSSIS